jgi:Domain of unknown function (DUF4350)
MTAVGATREAAGSPEGSRPVSPTARDVVRRIRFPLALAAFILLAGAAVALLQPHEGPRYLDPTDAGPFGARALAQILAHRGQHVTRVSTAQQAARSATASTTVVITGSAFLDRRALAALGRIRGDRMLVEPDQPTLSALAPGIRTAGVFPVTAVDPACGLAAARLAGDADMGGVVLRTPGRGVRTAAHRAWNSQAAAQECYPSRNGASLIRYATGGRTITVLGTGAPLSNGNLADRGNAALALNLLAGNPAIIWLTPGSAVLAAGPGGRRTITDLIPAAADLIVIQLLIAAAVAAVWRSRRLGPLVFEPLPVVVRAAETVEGHGRLYRARRARGRAAQALRAGVVSRLVARLGLPARASPATITAAVSARSGRDIHAVEAMLFGPAPGNDQALVQLASGLDDLEREVRTT